MNKYFFISKRLIKRMSLIAALFLFFKFYFLGGLVLFLIATSLFLFRIKQIDLGVNRTIGPHFVVAPVSGRVVSISPSEENTKNTLIVINILPWKCYGVFLPLSGEIVDSNNTRSTPSDKRITTLIQNKNGLEVKLHYYCNLKLLKPLLFVREGDFGQLGALIGYLPFGGKVVIELPNECGLLLQNGDKLSSSQTLIASFKDQSNE